MSRATAARPAVARQLARRVDGLDGRASCSSRSTRPGRRRRRLGGSVATALMRAEAEDFEILRSLGTVSYSIEPTGVSNERTLSWSGGDDGCVPDSFSVSGGSIASTDVVIKLYAAKVIGWSADSATEDATSAVPDVLLKEYVDAPAAALADAEVEAYMKLYGDPNDSTIGVDAKGTPYGEAFDPASLPVAPLIAYFSSAAVGEGGGYGTPKRSLWTVQRWGRGGLTRLADYPRARQEKRDDAQPWWPPIQRVRDVGLGPRHRYVRNAARGAIAAVAAVHQRGVAHNAIDATAFQVSTTRDADADELEVRLMNFGFASALTEAGRVADLRGAAAACAELVFSALSTRGSDGIDGATDAATLAKLFERVFELDPKRAREYCAEEPSWEHAVEFLDYKDSMAGDGWTWLTDMWRAGDVASAEDFLARAEAVDTPYD